MAGNSEEKSAVVLSSRLDPTDTKLVNSIHWLLAIFLLPFMAEQEEKKEEGDIVDTTIRLYCLSILSQICTLTISREQSSFCYFATNVSRKIIISFTVGTGI